MSEFVLNWNSTGLTHDEESITVNYYEENPISATISARWEEWETPEQPPEPEPPLPDVLVNNYPCRVVVTSDLYPEDVTITNGWVSGNTDHPATIVGTVNHIFFRELKYLLDNVHWSKRIYGEVSAVPDLPEKKLFLYSYYKEQVPEKEINVYATAYYHNGVSETAVGSRTFKVTVINIFNDGQIIRSILDKHENLPIED
jgi:hypothetical protein